MPMYRSETVEKATTDAVRKPLSFVFGKRPPSEPLKKAKSPKCEITVDPQIEAEVQKRVRREAVVLRAAIDGLHETIDGMQS